MTSRRSPSAGERAVRRVIRAKSLGVLLGVLLGCQAPPPPPPPPAPPPEPSPPSVPSVPNPVGASWSFTVTETTCIAHASNPAVTLTVRVGKNQAVLSVMAAAMKSSTKANAHAQLRFKGTDGSWTTPARTDSRHAVTAYLHLNDTAANNVLLLLGGGRLQTEVAKTVIPVLRIPDSDVSGREWFGCVRREVGRSAPGG